MKHKLAIYQILTRLFGNKNTNNLHNGSIGENGVGKLKDINTKALAEIKAMGITHVWYTGVIEHATATDYRQFGIEPDHEAMLKGKAGSPYAIKDYYDIAPDLATNVPNRMKEFENLVRRTHKADLKVIIDFIPNHLARTYQSDAKPAGTEEFGETDNQNTYFDPQNNFYYLPNERLNLPNQDRFATAFEEYPARATGNDVFHSHPSEHDWYETIKLNYGINYFYNREHHFEPIPKTWHMMKEVLLFWAKKGVDGFRCDMAEMVPVEFWAWATKEVKVQYPEVIFIAEIYNPRLYHDFIHTGGFDYLYDKVGLYDTLRAIVEERGSANQITNCWQEQHNLGDHMLRFLENHDEQRIASGFFAIDSYAAIPAMVVSATLHRGPIMLYFGQEVGEPAKDAQGFSGEDGRTSIFDYCGVPEHQKWMNGGKFDGGKLAKWQQNLRSNYIKILQMCQTKEAFHSGDFYDLQYLNHHGNYNSGKIYAYFRYTDKQKMLVICNFDRHAEHTVSLKLSEHVFETLGLDKGKSLKGKELFRNISFETSFEQSIQAGIPLRLLPIQSLVFTVRQ